MVNKQTNNICINEEFLSGIVPELSFVFLSSIFKIYLENLNSHRKVLKSRTKGQSGQFRTIFGILTKLRLRHATFHIPIYAAKVRGASRKL